MHRQTSILNSVMSCRTRECTGALLLQSQEKMSQAMISPRQSCQFAALAQRNTGHGQLCPINSSSVFVQTQRSPQQPGYLEIFGLNQSIKVKSFACFMVILKKVINMSTHVYWYIHVESIHSTQLSLCAQQYHAQEVTWAK